MGKGKKHKSGKRGNVAPFPKMECCSDKPRCTRCPIRMLKEGTLPEGYAVHKRRLVRLDGSPVTKPGKKKSKKQKAA